MITSVYCSHHFTKYFSEHSANIDYFRFGDGYTVTVRCAKANQEELLSRIEKGLPSARLEDCHCSQLKFSIPQSDARLSDIFNVMCEMKDESLIEDYSVSQTTLDDVRTK
jgi:hypothetical protein